MSSVRFCCGHMGCPGIVDSAVSAGRVHTEGGHYTRGEIWLTVCPECNTVHFPFGVPLLTDHGCVREFFGNIGDSPRKQLSPEWTYVYALYVERWFQLSRHTAGRLRELRILLVHWYAQGHTLGCLRASDPSSACTCGFDKIESLLVMLS